MVIRNSKRWALPCVLAVAACTGEIEPADAPGDDATRAAAPQVPVLPAGASAGDDAPTVPAPFDPAKPRVCAGPAPGPSGLRRLTRFEYNNTVRDLLGEESKPAEAFPGEEQSAGFDNDASALTVQRLLAEAYLAAAERMAASALQRDPQLLACPPSSAAADEACVKRFIERVGQRVYRRPLQAAEGDRLLGVYRTARADAGVDVTVAAEVVLQTMLISPQFLYRVEDPAPARGAPVALSPWEMASRLSYLFWGSMPDQALLESARLGKLAKREEIAAEARRLMGDPRARDVTRHFYRMWLQLGQVGGQAKDVKLYPDFTAEIPVLLRHETDTFVERTLFGGDGSWKTLLTSPEGIVNKTLARFYRLPASAGVASDTMFQPVRFDSAQRAGLLTHASLMSQLATADHTHPIARGVFVRRQLLCAAPPDPPPDIVGGDESKLGPNATARERLAAHRNNPACGGCHRLIDPIGYALENYGADGRYRTKERNGQPVDASGEIAGTDVEGTVVGPVQLAARLANSQEVRRCHVMNWLRFAHGRGLSDEDLCTVDALDRAFVGAGTNVRELLVGLSQTDAFLHRTVPR